MSTADAAAFVGLSMKTLANLRSEGSGPPFTKVRGKVIYRTQDLEDWIDSHY
ncbi:helix-turn-helix domain-containing protein [Corynebacterium hadale]